MADWALIVGERVASMTTPRRLDRGTLTIDCAGATAMNLHYVGQELISRINAHVGGQTVVALRFTQAGMPPRPPQTPQPPPVAAAEAAAAVAHLPEGELRDALFGLGRLVLGRQGATPKSGRNKLRS